MGRIAALDYGTARIGLAISDEKKWLATPVGSIQAGRTLLESVKQIVAAIAPYPTLEILVLGLPLHLSGKESAMSQQVRQLASLLETVIPCPIILWDERLSSAQVDRTLKEAEVSRKNRAKIIDAQAAAAILQNYLDALQQRGISCQQ